MIVSTSAGALRGAERRHEAERSWRAGGGTQPELVEFRGVRYATTTRFGPPEPPKPWEGVADAVVPGPMSPQLRARTGPVTGEADERGLVQDEDCLTLTVRTPGVGDGGPRPVLVWIPGGAYVTGSESWPWYDTSALAAEGDVVTVSVTYRLGALGWLRAPGVSPGNLGLLDLLAALRWVQDEISAFGGDPERVTVMGHSAGAHAIACLLTVPGIGSLTSRAILQSGQLGLGLASERQAARTARFVTDALDGRAPATVPLDELMHAQKVAMRRAAGPGAVNAAPAFAPVAGVDPLPAGVTWADAARGAADAGIDLLVGATAREATTFLAISPVLARLWRAPALGRLVDAGAAVATRRVFTRPARRLADDATRAGARVHTYLFDWGAPASDLGACHAIELPFLLGTRESWERAPMLAGASWERDVAPLGAAMRAAWLSFVRSGAFETTPVLRSAIRHR